jgi:hypothetical protein
VLLYVKSVYYIVFIYQLIYLPSSNNSIFQKKLKSSFIERKYNKAVRVFEQEKEKENFIDLINSYTEKVDYLIKNDLLNYDNIKKEITQGIGLIEEYSYFVYSDINV